MQGQGPGIAVISDGTTLKGEIKNVRHLDVHGYVEGRVVGGTVVIHPGGRIYGTVKSDALEVMGTFQGDAAIKQLLHIGSNGAVRGNARYGRLAVDAGGLLEADVRNIPPELGGDLNITVRRGGRVTVTTVDLTAFDPDDGAQALTYRVSNALGGFVALAAAPTAAVEAFTQADLLAGVVQYVHDGSDAPRGGFDVVVTDASGANSGPPRTVTATVQAA